MPNRLEMEQIGGIRGPLNLKLHVAFTHSCSAVLSCPSSYSALTDNRLDLPVRVAE